MARSTRPSFSNFVRQLRPGAQRGSKRRSTDSTASADSDQHARISKVLAQAREGQLFELLRLVRSITLANISAPAAATANLATQSNSVRILSACRQPPASAGALAALTAAGQLDGWAPAASRALWGLMPFKLTSSSAKGPSATVPCDAEPQTIGAVYTRLSNDPLWLLSASGDPPTSFGLMLEGRSRGAAAERDAEQCVLEFAQLADAGERQGAAQRWRRAERAAGAGLGQERVVGGWQEQQEEEERGAQAMYAFASTISSQDGSRAASRCGSGSQTSALSDADAAQLMYAYAALVSAPGAEHRPGRVRAQQGRQQLRDEEAVQLLRLLAGLAGEGVEARTMSAQPRASTQLQGTPEQDAHVLQKYVHLS